MWFSLRCAHKPSVILLVQKPSVIILVLTKFNKSSRICLCNLILPCKVQECMLLKRESGVNPERSGHCIQGVLFR